MQLERAVKAIFPPSTSSLSFFIRSLTQGFRFGLLRSAIRYVGCLPMLLGTKAWAGSWRRSGGPPATPVISPVVTHPTWFNEKSGGDAFCCAATCGASAAQTKPARTPPARNLPLEKSIDIVPSSWSFCYRAKSSSEAAIILKNRVQQNLGSGCAFLEACRFRLVMAEALEAGDEDHGGRSYSRDIDRIMAGARYHIARPQSRFLGRPPHAADQLRRETNGRRCPDLLFLIGQSQRIEDRRQRKSHALLHLFEDIVLPMAQVDGEENFARYDIAAVRPVLDEADRRDPESEFTADGVDSVDNPGGAEQGVLAQMHRRRTRMGVLAANRYVIPPHTLHAGDDADGRAGVLQDRSLLDMKLDHGPELVSAGLLGATVADAHKRILERIAVAILAPIGKVQRECAGEHAGAEHGGGEARAFLVGPVDDLDGRVGFVGGLL